MLKEPVDDWFEACGVPHFIHRYSAAKRLPDLCIVLCVVLAFELGVAPWLELDVVQLAVAPLVLFVLTLWARPALVPLFDLERASEIGGWATALRLFSLGIVTGYLTGLLDVPRMDAWVNFALLLATFAAATVLFSKRLWLGNDPLVRKKRRQLVKILVALVVLFAIEGSVFDSFNREFAQVEPTLGELPQGMPALACVALLLWLAIRLSHRCAVEESAVGHTDPAAGFQLAAVPALLLIFGGETAVLPHAADDGWLQAAIPLALVLVSLVVAGVAAAAIARRDAETAGDDGGGNGRPTAATVALCVLALMFALGYPLLAGMYFTIDAFGTPLRGEDAFLVTFGINMLCIGVGWLFVSLGIDRIAAWTLRAAWRSKLSVLQGMARGLPLLLVFSAFFVMQAELWEVVVEIGTLEYLGLVLVMVALAVAFGYVAAHKEVVRGAQFRSWRDVAGATFRTEHPSYDPPVPEPFQAKVRELAARQGRPEAPPLEGFKYLNAVAVMSVYQTAILLPVALAAGALFWVLARIAVPASVAGEWVYGDGAPRHLGEALAHRGFLDQPWTRVAIILGAFSALYLTVNVLSTADQRKDFFDGADKSVRKRLAVRVAYTHLVPRDPVADGSRFERLRSRIAVRLERPWPGRSPTGV